MWKLRKKMIFAKNSLKPICSSFISFKDIGLQTEERGSGSKVGLVDFLTKSVNKFYGRFVGDDGGNSQFGNFMKNLRIISNNFKFNRVLGINGNPFYIFDVFNDKNGNVQYQIAFLDKKNKGLTFFVKNKIISVCYNKKFDFCVFHYT